MTDVQLVVSASAASLLASVSLAVVAIKMITSAWVKNRDGDRVFEASENNFARILTVEEAEKDRVMTREIHEEQTKEERGY